MKILKLIFSIVLTFLILLYLYFSIENPTLENLAALIGNIFLYLGLLTLINPKIKHFLSFKLKGFYRINFNIAFKFDVNSEFDYKIFIKNIDDSFRAKGFKIDKFIKQNSTTYSIIINGYDFSIVFDESSEVVLVKSSSIVSRFILIKKDSKMISKLLYHFESLSKSEYYVYTSQINFPELKNPLLPIYYEPETMKVSADNLYMDNSHVRFSVNDFATLIDKTAQLLDGKKIV